MRELAVRSERGAYRVVVGEGLVWSPEVFRGYVVGRQAVVVSNVTVGPLYAGELARVFGLAEPLELPDGERYKAWPQVERICREALGRGVGREGLLVGVGGGVVTDMVGFAASVLLRGVDWIAVPTTLLAMVDAAIGGKTGIDLAEGKNLIGTFWPPRLVVADVGTLRTLPPRELRAGLAEVVKSAWIGDRGLLETLPPVEAGASLDGPAWEELVARAAAVKVRVVEEDERESGVRQALNLGHTVGHALEAATGYRRFLHGEAVAWGLLVVGRISRERGLLSKEGWQALRAAVHRLEPLPPVADVDLETLVPYLGRDKKRDGEGVAWVLPKDDGVLVGQRVTDDELRAAWEAVTAGSPWWSS